MWIRSTKTTMWNSESDVWLLRIKNIYPIPRSVGISTANSMELLKLMMFKSDFLSNGKCDDRVPPINLSQLPEFLLCKSQLGSSWAFVSFHQPTDCLTDGQMDGRKRSSVLYCTEKNFKIIYIYVVFIFVKHAVEIFLLPTNIVETGGLSVFFRQSIVTQQCSKHFYKLYYTPYNS